MQRGSSDRALQVHVTALADCSSNQKQWDASHHTIGCVLGSVVTILLKRENRIVKFRFLLNCGATVAEKRERIAEPQSERRGVGLTSCVAECLSRRRSLLASLDGVLLTGYSLEECGGLPLLLKLIEETKEMREESSTRLPPIYCTGPTAKIGKLNLYDLVTHLDESVKCNVELRQRQQPSSHRAHWQSTSVLQDRRQSSSPNPSSCNSHSLPQSPPLSSIASSSSSASSSSPCVYNSGFQSASSNLLDHVDSVFDHCVRVTYREIVAFKKNERLLNPRKSPPEGNGRTWSSPLLGDADEDELGVSDPKMSMEKSTASLSTMTLTLRAYPSGASLGGAVWYLSAEGHQSTVLLSHKLTTKPNWFYDGLDCQVLPRPPSVAVTSFPFRFPPCKQQQPMNLIRRETLDPRLPPVGPLLSSSPLSSSALLLSQLSVRIPVLPSLLLDSTSACRLVALTQQTLQSGGSVLIPCDIHSSTLKLLLLLEATWNFSLRQFPIMLVVPTGSLLIDFAKTMLGWMSSAVRNQFSTNRQNPFHSLQYIQTFTSPDDALRVAPTHVPKVFISTPSSLEFGFTRKLFLEICSNPKSLVVIPRSPSPYDFSIFRSTPCTATTSPLVLDVNELQSRSLPTDKLYDRYLEEQARRSSSTRYMVETPVVPLNPFSIVSPLEQPERVSEQQVFSSIHLEAAFSEVDFTALLMDRWKRTSEQITRSGIEVAASIANAVSASDAYGDVVQLDGNETTLEDSQMVRSGVTVQEVDVWHSGVSSKRLKLLRASGMFEDSDALSTVPEKQESYPIEGEREQVAAAIEAVPDSETVAPSLPAWRKQLRQWCGGEDPMETVSVSSQLSVVCQSLYLPELFKDDVLLPEPLLDLQSLAEWAVVSLRPIKARNFILLPSSIHPALLQTLLRCCLLSSSSAPRVHVCQSVPSTYGAMESDVDREPKQLFYTAATKVEWNENLVELTPPIWNLLKARKEQDGKGGFSKIPAGDLVQRGLGTDPPSLLSDDGERGLTRCLRVAQHFSSSLDVVPLQLCVREDFKNVDGTRVGQEDGVHNTPSEEQKMSTVEINRNKSRSDVRTSQRALKTLDVYERGNLPQGGICFSRVLGVEKQIPSLVRTVSEERETARQQRSRDFKPSDKESASAWASPERMDDDLPAWNELVEIEDEESFPKNVISFGHTDRQSLNSAVQRLFGSQNIKLSLSPSATIHIGDASSIVLRTRSSNPQSNSIPLLTTSSITMDSGLDLQTMLIRKLLTDQLFQIGFVFEPADRTAS